VKTYECVDKHQYEADRYHAEYMRIEAVSPAEAKMKYCRNNKGTEYIDVLCRTEKGYPQW